MSVQTKPITRPLSLTDLLPPGTILCNRYTVLRLIGEGGSAQVYLVYDRRFQQYHALKQMPRSPGLSDAGVVVGPRCDHRSRYCLRSE